MTEQAEKILIVEDEPGVRRALLRLLERSGYRALAAADANEARLTLAQEDVSLVLTDMTMPGQSGLDLIEFIREAHPDVATIMVTGQDSTQLAETAMEQGAYGYVIKPFKNNEIRINVSNALRRRRLEIENRRHQEKLEMMVQDRTRDLWTAIQDLEQTQQDLRFSRRETIERLSIAAEHRSDETAAHIRRVSNYCGLLATRAGQDKETSETISLASAMHDIGKIGIPDSILLKPAALTTAEWEVMKRHTLIGYHILGGSNSMVLKLAARIALSHHEHYDGAGYPRGLKGVEIPIEGRLVAIVDAFDALTSDRPYRQAVPIPDAVEKMRPDRGTHFDPALFDEFLGSLPEVIRVKEEEDRRVASAPLRTDEEDTVIAL